MTLFHSPGNDAPLRYCAACQQPFTGLDVCPTCQSPVLASSGGAAQLCHLHGKPVTFDGRYCYVCEDCILGGAAPRGREDFEDALIQRVSELPDRTSPDDWPEAMLVTADELRGIVRDLLIASPAIPRPEEAVNAELLAALKAVTETGDDCPACDRGVLRHPENGHWPKCPFGHAQLVIARAEGR